MTSNKRAIGDWARRVASTFWDGRADASSTAPVGAKTTTAGARCDARDGRRSPVLADRGAIAGQSANGSKPPKRGPDGRILLEPSWTERIGEYLIKVTLGLFPIGLMREGYQQLRGLDPYPIGYYYGWLLIYLIAVYWFFSVLAREEYRNRS